MKVFMPEVAPDVRKQLLQQNADQIEETDYLKPLTVDELDVRRETLTDNAIKISEYEDEKKEIMTELKSKIDPLARHNKVLLDEIKTRQAKVKGVIYHLANHEENMMESFDENGEMISSRRLRPDEKRQNIFNIKKTAEQ